jgi:AcrR family transcriptional regulator
MSAAKPASRTPPGPRPALGRPAVLAAALAIADEQGLERLTMRRLAAALGVAPMGLYRYFPNKAALVAGLYDAAIGDYDPRQHEGGSWREQTESSFRWFRCTLVGHPAVLPLTARRAGLGPTTDRISEHVLGILREAAASDAEATRSFYALVSHTVGFAILESATRRERVAAGISDDAEWLRLSGLRFESLPRAEFPNLVALATHIGSYWTDAQFEDGLGRILDSVVLAEEK